MENFNEMFEAAKVVADRRNKIYNQLIAETKEMLPDYCKAIETLGYDYFMFDQKNQTIINQEAAVSINFEKNYPVIVYANGTIADCEWKFDGEYDEAVPVRTFTVSEVKLTKTGIISFIKQLNYKLKVMTEKREAQNKAAEELLKKQ